MFSLSTSQTLLLFGVFVGVLVYSAVAVSMHNKDKRNQSVQSLVNFFIVSLVVSGVGLLGLGYESWTTIKGGLGAGYY